MASLQDIPVNRIDGTPASLGDYAGKVVLVVNVASKCGLTPQYDGLETLYETYGGQGLVVAGFPANEFAGQEPGSNAEIAEFCETRFNIKFPMFEKIVVKGEGKHP
ncbi:MAG: glutathione peroxidase, partial [Caulobacteraceae bacterium]|nr:glutathione peroxidase [Caulobacteraceae bacterium]